MMLGFVHLQLCSWYRILENIRSLNWNQLNVAWYELHTYS